MPRCRSISAVPPRRSRPRAYSYDAVAWIYDELAALYSFVFLYMATRGSGIWSVDALLGKKSGD